MTEVELRLLDAYWRAANYLSVGQIYLLDNPLLREPLRAEHVKPRLLGHFGTTPGPEPDLGAPEPRDPRPRPRRDLRHRARATAGRGSSRTPTSRARTPSSTRTSARDEDGLRELFRQFSFPGGIPSHAAPETPGSIHEGGELGYALAHAYGAAFDNPDLLVCCVVGDGEAETGPLAASWHSNKFLNPQRDGAVLPILHLNGYKIANPTVLARIPEAGARRADRGLRPPAAARHRRRPGARAPRLRRRARRRARRDRRIQQAARAAATGRPRWPMIVLRTPKGWTGPTEVDGKPVEGTWRSHQVPMSDVRGNPAHLAAARGVDAQLPAGGALRRARRARPGAGRAGARGRAADEREPARERRRPARPRPPGLPRLRGRREAAGHELDARRPACSAPSCGT